MAGMTLETFLDCLEMLFEQSLDILKGAVGIQEFIQDEGAILQQKCQQLQLLECGMLLFCSRHNGLVVDSVALKEAKDYRKIVEMREAAKKCRLEKKANKGG